MSHREPNGGRNKRSGEKKARKSKHLRTDKNGDIFTGSKSLSKHKKKNGHHHKKTKMNKAAISENLGNVVLVKNTKLGEVHKEQKKVTPPPQPLLRSQERQRKSADTYLQTSTQPEAHMRGTTSSNKTRRTCERSPSVVCSTTFQDRHFKCKKQLKSADKPQFCLAKNMKLLPKAKVFHSHGEANDTHSAKNDVLNGLEEVEETGNDITRNEKSEEIVARDRLTKWHKYVEEIVDTGAEGIQNSFRSVRGHLPIAVTRKEFDLNMKKNRFEDIVCIDQTRVRLEGNEYIHANWINISKERKAILTQLPMQHTAAAFWKMILDNDVQAILLILTHFEYQTFSASAVFPGQQDFLGFKEAHIYIGEFKRVTISKDWTLRIVSVRNGDKRRFVHIHHYSGWVHGKEPYEILDLWRIQSTFRKYSHPHVFVSLSGCGRAGTYAVFEMSGYQMMTKDSLKHSQINYNS